GLLQRVKHQINKRFLGPERMLDLGLRFGPYGRFGARRHGRYAGEMNGHMRITDLTLRKLKTAVHGIDLGPLHACLPGRLRTADKRIQLAPEVFVKDVERMNDLECRFRVPSSGVDGTLLLIGRRQLRSNNSWMHNSERLVKGKPRCTMLMNPVDAANHE